MQLLPPTTTSNPDAHTTTSNPGAHTATSNPGTHTTTSNPGKYYGLWVVIVAFTDEVT
jgi:hypothetical protein